MLAAGEVLHKFNFWHPVTALFYFPLTPQGKVVPLQLGVLRGSQPKHLPPLHHVANGAERPLCLVPAQPGLTGHLVYWFVNRSRAVPWVILTLNTIITGSGMSELVGVLVGHAYYFLRHRYPDDFNCSPPLSCCVCGFPITDGGGLRQRQR